MRSANLSWLLPACLLLAGPAAAQMPGAMGGAFVPGTPSTAAYNEAMTKMQAAMTTPYTGDADQDFVSGMIPHHQGAIDMAEVELKYGKDAKIKQLAARIIAAQEREIAFMKAWQAKHPPPKPLVQSRPGGPQVK